jgi:5-(carboxyamino)imidazole ribonucleotide mutase
MTEPLVAIIMGSQSDWATMPMPPRRWSARRPHETKVVSAHRTPDRLVQLRQGAPGAGFKVVIAGAGGAAHLPGMTAAMTPLPVFGVPVESKAMSGQDSLLSIVQMPAGIPVGTLAIGKAGAINAALLAAPFSALPIQPRRRVSMHGASAADSRRSPTNPAMSIPARARRHRHPRRRPARPHAGDRRRQSRLRTHIFAPRPTARPSRSPRAMDASAPMRTAALDCPLRRHRSMS